MFLLTNYPFCVPSSNPLEILKFFGSFDYYLGFSTPIPKLVCSQLFTSNLTTSLESLVHARYNGVESHLEDSSLYEPSHIVEFTLVLRYSSNMPMTVLFLYSTTSPTSPKLQSTLFY